MFDKKSLLCNEYFPAELPPCFSMQKVADNYEKIIAWTTGVKKGMFYSIVI